MYVQNNACHQRKTNQGNTWRRTALTTVSFRKSLQIDRNQSGKKNPIIIFICLEIEKMKLENKNQTK